MSYQSKIILWLQNDAYYLFNYELSCKSFTLFKIYGTNESPRCVAKDLSQIGVEHVIMYFCHKPGYIIDGNLDMTKSKLVEVLRSKDIMIEYEDLIRCQATTTSVFIQTLESNVLNLWQDAMDEFDVSVEGIDFPEQACLSLLPKNLKHRGCMLSIGNIQGESNMRWEFDASKFKLDPIQWGISLQPSNLLHSALPNIVNRQLLDSLDFKFISEHVCPIYSLEEAWELNFYSEDVSDARCGLLRASFESPLSVKALRSWRQTCVRLVASLGVLFILIQLATPKSDQQYAVVADELISKTTNELNDHSENIPSNDIVQKKLNSNMKDLWAGIDELKSNAKRLVQKSILMAEQDNISQQLPVVMPVLNYLQKAEAEPCGQFQLGLQKIEICKGQSILGKKLVLLDGQKSTWIDNKEKIFHINRVDRVRELKTRILQTSNDTEYLVELISDNSKSLIVDSWEGQPLKSKRDAEIVAEAIATGILSGDRLDITPTHSEARAGLSSLNSSKL